MEDNKVLQEIEDAILEENKAEVKADLEPIQEDNDLPAYLERNTVTLPLSEYLALYEQGKELSKLVWLFLLGSELDYDKAFLQVDRYSCKAIANEILRISPSQYLERYEELLKNGDTES